MSFTCPLVRNFFSTGRSAPYPNFYSPLCSVRSSYSPKIEPFTACGETAQSPLRILTFAVAEATLKPIPISTCSINL